MSDKSKVYGFMYNECIHESSWATVSLHTSREGAEIALEKHKAEKLEEFQTYKKWCEENDMGNPTFGEHEDWSIHEFEILP